MSMITAKEIMQTDVYTINENSNIKELLNLFIEKRISGVPVVGEDSKLAGIITDADILRQIHEYPSFLDFIAYVVVLDAEALTDAKIREMLGKPVKELMTENVITVEKDTSLAFVANMLSKKKYKKLPVVEGNKLVGIVTRSDVVRYLVQEFLRKA